MLYDRLLAPVVAIATTLLNVAGTIAIANTGATMQWTTPVVLAIGTVYDLGLTLALMRFWRKP